MFDCLPRLGRSYSNQYRRFSKAVTCRPCVRIQLIQSLCYLLSQEPGSYIDESCQRNVRLSFSSWEVLRHGDKRSCSLPAVYRPDFLRDGHNIPCHLAILVGISRSSVRVSHEFSTSKYLGSDP